MYCYEHVVDIIDRYKPEVIFNDINWPDFSKREGEYSLPALFDYYYSHVPTGVVNDRWGIPHWDYKTSEYKMNLHVEDGESGRTTVVWDIHLVTTNSKLMSITSTSVAYFITF